MANTSVGSLSASLFMETASFIKDTRKAQTALASETAKMRKSMREVEKATASVRKQFSGFRNVAAGLAGAFAVRQFGQFTRRALDSAAAIADVAEKVGLTTKELQQLRFAATQSGVKVAALDVAMQRFSRRVGDAAQGGGELVKVLEQQGIAVRNADGSMRRQVDVLGDFAEAIKGAESEQQQLLLAFKAFDTEGAALVNLLREGREGLKQYMQQAVAFGAVMDASVIAKAKAAGEALDAVSAVYTSSFDTAIVEAFAGSVVASADSLRAAQDAGRSFGQVVGQSMRGLLAATKVVAENLDLIKAAIAGLVAYKATAVFIGMAQAALRLAAAIKAAGAAQATLNGLLAANPIGLAATAIGAAVAAMIAYRDATFEVGQQTVQVGRLVSATWTAVLAPVKSLVGEMINLAAIAVRVISGDFTGALDAAKNIGQQFAGNIAEVRDAFADLAPPVKKATDAYTDNADAAKAVGAAVSENAEKTREAIAEVRMQVAQTERLIAAIRQGEDAYTTVSREIDLQNSALKAGIDLASAQGREWLSLARRAQTLTVELEALDKVQEKLVEIRESTEAYRVHERQTRDLIAATRRGEDAAKDMAEAIDLQNAALKLGVDLTTAQGRAWLEAARAAKKAERELEDLKDAQKEAADAAKKHREEMKRQQEEMQRLALEPWRRAIESIQDAFAGAFESIFRGGVDSFKDLARTIRDVMLRAAAEIAASLVFKPIIAGLGTLGLGSLAGSSEGATAGSDFGSITNLLGGLSSSKLGILGTDLAANLGLGNTGQMVLGNIGASLPATFTGTAISKLLGLGRGTGGTVGGTVGGIAGSAFFGPVGGAVGSFLGSAIGGLFGGKPSRKTGLATLENRTGRLVSQGGKGNSGALARRLVESVYGNFDKALDLVGGTARTGHVSVRDFANSGKFNGAPFTLFRGQTQLANFKSQGDLLNQGPLMLLQAAATIPAEFRAALAQSNTIGEFIQLAKQIKATTAAEKKAQEQAKKQAEQAKKQAAEQERMLEKQRQLEVRAGLANAAGGIVGFLRSQSLSPDSSLSPTRRLVEAQRQFGDLLSRVRGGEYGLSGALTQSADALLSIGRDNFASSVSFANLETFVRSSLTGVAENLLSEDTFRAQVEATRQQTDVLSSDLKAVETAVKALRTELRLLSQKLAA